MCKRWHTEGSWRTSIWCCSWCSKISTIISRMENLILNFKISSKLLLHPATPSWGKTSGEKRDALINVVSKIYCYKTSTVLACSVGEEVLDLSQSHDSGDNLKAPSTPLSQVSQKKKSATPHMYVCKCTVTFQRKNNL